jgi:hypothetical protein
MKFKSFIFVVILCFIGYYLFTNPLVVENTIPIVNEVVENIKELLSNESLQEKEMSTFIKENNLDSMKVEDGNIVLIRFSSDSILNMNQLIYDVALKAYDVFKKSLRVEGYFFDEPVFALETNNPNNEESLLFIDIRNQEFMIENDIMIFDVLVESVKIKNNNVFVDVEYFGQNEDFFDDFSGMSFVIVQDMPGVQDITIKYLKDELCLSMKTTSFQVLELYNENISMESFLEILELENCSSEVTDFVDKDQVNDIDDGRVIIDSGLRCSTDIKEAYQQYMQAYNKVVYLMERGEKDTPAFKNAYIPYEFYKDCWDDVNPEN